MKFFVDTAEIKEIRDLLPTGLVDGVTTNPSLVMKSGRNFREVVAEICDLIPGPVSAEVTALEAAKMIEEGKSLAKIAGNVVVKLPLTLDGIPPLAGFAFDLPDALPLTTLFIQEMLRRGFLASTHVYAMLAHDDTAVASYLDAVAETFHIVAAARGAEPSSYLQGPVKHAGFKRLN